MPVIRRLVAHGEDAQILRCLDSGRFLVNNAPDWQMLFGPKSALTGLNLKFRVGAQFDTDSFSKIKLVATLYPADSVAGAYALGSVTFKVARISAPQWTEIDLVTITGTELANNHWYAEVDIADLLGANLDGDTTLEIVGIGTRQDIIYREMIFVNHLGVYDSIVRLRQDVEWLDLSKLDE